MSWYLYLILAYLLVLMGFNFYRSFKVKTQDEMMVAGRSLSMRVMVFTLICTWIGSGTFIAGAEYAVKAGSTARPNRSRPIRSRASTGCRISARPDPEIGGPA